MMQDDKHSGFRAFRIPFLLVCCMWLVFLVESVSGISFVEWGILPRMARGLLGILTAPFVHSDINHIASNTVPILVVGTGLFYFYPTLAWRVLLMINFFTGLWVWMAARSSYHIGASGIVYGLVCFLFFSGLIRGDKRLLAISLLVTFLYGSLVWGILPVDQSVSWESHLFGAISGLLAALYYRKEGPAREKYSWELEEERAALGYDDEAGDIPYKEGGWYEEEDEDNRDIRY